MDVGRSQGLTEAVIQGSTFGQPEAAGLTGMQGGGTSLSSTVGAALGSATAGRVGGGILQGKVNQGLAFGSPLAGQGNPLDALRDRSRGQFDPALARNKRRDDWTVWIEVKAESIRRMREMLPTSDERRKEFRILLMGFRESRKLAQKRLARFKPTSAEIRQGVQKKLEVTNEVLDAAAERKAVLGLEFVAAQQEKSEIERKHQAHQGRKQQVKSLQALAIQVRAATKREIESEAASDKSTQLRRLADQANALKDRVKLGQSITEKREIEARAQEAAGREKSMAIAELMAPQPTAKMDEEATRPIEVHRDKESLLVKDGGLKSLFEQFTKEEKGGGGRTAREAPGSSLMRAKVDEKRQSLIQHEDTEEREPPVKLLVDYKPISVPQKTVLQRLEAPTPEYRSEEEHLADTREIESSSQLDARELRDDPVRLSRKDIARERGDVDLPKPEVQTNTDGISPVI